jgi:hypothetical protein
MTISIQEEPTGNNSPEAFTAEELLQRLEVLNSGLLLRGVDTLSLLNGLPSGLIPPSYASWARHEFNISEDQHLYYWMDNRNLSVSQRVTAISEASGYARSLTTVAMFSALVNETGYPMEKEIGENLEHATLTAFAVWLEYAGNLVITPPHVMKSLDYQRQTLESAVQLLTANYIPDEIKLKIAVDYQHQQELLQTFLKKMGVQKLLPLLVKSLSFCGCLLVANEQALEQSTSQERGEYHQAEFITASDKQLPFSVLDAIIPLSKSDAELLSKGFESSELKSLIQNPFQG